MSEKPTEDAVAVAIFREIRPSSKAVAPRYQPPGWWECDVYAITKSDYPIEYEIKLTLADFRSDREKSRYRFRGGGRSIVAEGKKHDRLDEGHASGPSRFFYVVAEDIADEVEAELPKFAGLLVTRKAKTTPRAHIFKRKDAPRLHRKKLSDPDREIRRIHSRLYHRYWDLFVSRVHGR